MDPTTDPVGVWADIYTDRVARMADLPAVDWSDPSTDVERFGTAERDRPFGVPEATQARGTDRSVPGPHGPVPVRIYRPEVGEQSGVGLVWCHGGAFILGDLDMPEADLVARGLVTRAGCVVVSVDYRLCHNGIQHPIPHDDVWAVFGWLRAHAAEVGVDPLRVAVGGASAGGNLAASVALHSRDAGTPAWRTLLGYPLVHPVLPEPSPQLASLLAITPPVLRFPPEAIAAINGRYLGRPLEEADPYAFAALADDLGGYPSTYIENAEFDDLRSSGEAFADRLRAAGVPVTTATAAGVPHGHLNAIGSPLTSATLDRFAAQLIVPELRTEDVH